MSAGFEVLLIEVGWRVDREEFGWYGLDEED